MTKPSICGACHHHSALPERRCDCPCHDIFGVILSYPKTEKPPRKAKTPVRAAKKGSK